MKTNTTRKILVLLFAFIAIFSFSFFAVSSTAKAEVALSSYFTYEGRTLVDGDLTFSDDLAKIKMYDGKKVKTVNELVFDDFSVKLVLGNFTELKVIARLSSLDPNGAKKGDSFDTSIENTVKIVLEGTTLKATFNGKAEKTLATSYTEGMELDVKFTLASDKPYLNASVLGEALDREETDYYMIDKNSALDGVLVFESTGCSLLSVKSIDQKTADLDGKYNQTFVMQDGDFKTKAYPRVVMSDNIFNYVGTEYVVVKGAPYSVSLTPKSFIGNTDNVFKLVASADVIVDGTTVVFNTDSASNLYIKNADETIIYEAFGFSPKAIISDTEAPKYNDNQNAIDSFNNALNNLVYTFEGDKKVQQIKVGSSEYLTLSKDMFKAMISDNTTSFDNLTATLYYWLPCGDEKNVSTFKINLTEAGTYKFFVIFTDKAGNKIDIDNFYTQDVSNSQKFVDGRPYAKYIFGFTVVDDTKIEITAPSVGDGYKGVEYNLSSFTITGTSYNESYKLYYSEKEIAEDASGWTEIVSASNATDESATYNGYSYSDIKSINYDGKLTFTPNKVGYYKVVCSVSSQVSADSAEKAVIINVGEQSKKVTPDNHWLKNNVWSVVFLSVGTLCLIGIIVILCIKPKKVDDDEVDSKK